MNPNDPSFWQNHYRNNHFPWDLGGPTPVLQRFAETGQITPGKMVVLGAGRGHDARMFARHGFQVTAVDFADAAIEALQEMNDPQAAIEVIQSDFFWLPPPFNGRYDIVLDYTCFCAILPARRGEYADLVTRLLKPDGHYLTLAFPIGTRPGGPPFTVQPDDIIELFSERGFILRHREYPPDSVPARKGVEELLLLAKTTP